jgi:sugar phosphate isomerase/epimerase
MKLGTGGEQTLKIACCSWGFKKAFDRGEMDMLSFIDLAADLGFDGVEPATGALASIRRRYFHELTDRLCARRIEISSLAVSNEFTHPDPRERAAQCDDIAGWFWEMKDLGVERLRTFNGFPPEGSDPEEMRARVWECYERIVPPAERAGRIITVENHEGAMGTADEVLKLVDHFSSPHLQLNVDPANFVAGHADRSPAEREPLYADTARVAAHAQHVHLKLRDFDAEGRPANLDVPRILSILRHVSYRGWISFEIFGTDDPAEVAKKGLKYLRALTQ